jgi:hypothetical protein
MTRAERPNHSDEAWTAWRNKALSAMQEVSSAATAEARRDALERHEAVYKKARTFWRNVFGGKCAYCETFFEASSFVDVEHFRPKGTVADVKGGPITRTIDGRQQPHPGYYWLAFEWSNLLPSCQKCNRPAKASWFPIANERNRVYAPGPLTSEEPLILNPFEDDPDDHLNFDTAHGVVAARNDSPKGRTTIEVLDLNRGGLCLARLCLHADIKKYAAAVINAHIDCDREQLATLASELRARWAPSSPYAAVWRAKTNRLVRWIEDVLRNNPDEGPAPGTLTAGS